MDTIFMLTRKYYIISMYISKSVYIPQGKFILYFIKEKFKMKNTKQ